MNKKRVLFYLLILSTLAIGQHPSGRRQMPSIGIIWGTVVDSSTNEPISYASLSLIRLRGEELVTGGITQEDGSFRIENIPVGRYQVRIEFIGYEPRTLDPIMLVPGRGEVEQDLGTIALQQRALEMDQVVVSGERPLFQQSLEKKVFNVEQNTLSIGGSALDALRQVPAVDVDVDGNISLRGNQNVHILIDGKPSSLTGGNRQAVLEAIPADNLQDIEIITNPSAKYDPDGMAGIINIILKENRLAGLNGSVNLSAGQREKYSGFGQVNFKNRDLNLFMNLSGRIDNRDRYGTNERRMTLPDLTSALNQNNSGTRSRDMVFLRTGAEYTFNRQHSLGLNLTLNLNRGDLDNRTNTEESINGANPYDYLRTTDGKNGGFSQDIALRYDRKFSNSKRSLNASLNISSGTRDDESEYRTEPGSSVMDQIIQSWQKSLTDRNNRVTTLQTDYVHPLGKDHKLEAGYKSILRRMDEEFYSESKESMVDSFREDTHLSNRFIYDEGIHAAYLMTSGKKNKVGYQAGLRVETAATESELVTSSETFTNNYISFFPSGALSYEVGRGNEIQLSYSRRINRPSVRRLNPFPSLSDDRSRRQGNPFLKPEYIDVVELNLSRFARGVSTSVGFYGRRTTDRIRHFSAYEDSILITSFINLDESKTYGAEFILSGRVYPTVRLVLSGNLFRDEYDVSSLNQDDILNKNLDNSSTGFFGRLNATWTPIPGTEIMFSTFYRAPFDVPQGRISNMIFSDLSIRKRFWDRRGSLTLQFRDPFDAMRFEFEFDKSNQFYQHGIRNWESQILILTFEYRFGSMEDQSPQHRRGSRNGNGDEMEDMGI